MGKKCTLIDNVGKLSKIKFFLFVLHSASQILQPKFSKKLLTLETKICDKNIRAAYCITAGPSSQQQSISSKKFPPFNIWSKAYLRAATTVVVFCYCVWNSCLFHILRHDLYTRDSISSFLATMVHFLLKTFLSCNWWKKSYTQKLFVGLGRLIR